MLISIFFVSFISFQGCLLLYGTYLAGLTSNVSHPPVNQSPTIITAVTLVTVSSVIVVPVFTFLKAWPNLVYTTVAGAIFICTLATNCMLFVPQVRNKINVQDAAKDMRKLGHVANMSLEVTPSVW